MKSFRPAVSLFGSLLVTFVLLSGAHAAVDLRVNDLVPNRNMAITAQTVVKRLEQLHFKKLPLNDQLSSTLFDRYLADLDPTRSYFLDTDIKEFERYRFQFDDDLLSGNLNPAFLIFNRYQKRMIDRLTFTDTLLQKELAGWKYDSGEEVEVDRKDAAWPRDAADWDHIWRKRVMNNALNLKLTGKTQAEILKTLTRRNKNQMTRVLQVNAEDAFQIYINSLTGIYDPHTQYLAPNVSENFNINMSLQLEGIGAVLQGEDEYTKIQSLVTGGPAERSGLLRPADRIVGVAQEGEEIVDIIGWRLDEVVKLIRGKKGTKVTLEVIPVTSQNDHDTRKVTITRDTVKLEDRAAQYIILDSKTGPKPHKIGVINIPAFYADFQCMQRDEDNCRSTTRDVERILVKLQQEGIDGLVIDLRNNGGGALNEANSLVGLFIPRGPTVQIKSSAGRVETMIDGDPDIAWNGPMAVLVNRLSASASEIFAGAIQDYRRGLVIGERTFGKGTVQSLQSIDKGQLKITLAKFYRISGASNQHTGILPDIAVPSLLDHTELGESALPNALPTDTIRPAMFRSDGRLEPLLPGLRSSFETRMSKNPDFVYLNGQIALQDEIRAKTTVSLNETLRRKEQETLDQRRMTLENTKRKAKGEAAFKTLEEMRKETEAEETKALAEQGRFKEDYVLTEVGRIMADYVDRFTNNSQVAAH
jgi:carboxyl-terminal processing protease